MSAVRVIFGALCLFLAGGVFAAETPADKFRKILPAIEYLLLRERTTTEFYNVYADHLDTPRLITNQVGQAVWRYDNNDPFGGNVPDENPSALGAFEFPLRDAGVYFDKETGLAYNVNRYRDLPSGRFIQADPLGLAGGDLSLYVLRRNDPLSFTDPEGLQPPSYGFPWSAPPGFVPTVPQPLQPAFFPTAEGMRQWGHDNFPGEANSSMRHCVVSCRLAQQFSVNAARAAGVGNELQGLVIDYGVIQFTAEVQFFQLLGMPVSARGQRIIEAGNRRALQPSAWAFQFQDFRDNERGFICASACPPRDCIMCCKGQ